MSRPSRPATRAPRGRAANSGLPCSTGAPGRRALPEVAGRARPRPGRLPVALAGPISGASMAPTRHRRSTYGHHLRRDRRRSLRAAATVEQPPARRRGPRRRRLAARPTVVQPATSPRLATAPRQPVALGGLPLRVSPQPEYLSQRAPIIAPSAQQLEAFVEDNRARDPGPARRPHRGAGPAPAWCRRDDPARAGQARGVRREGLVPGRAGRTAPAPSLGSRTTPTRPSTWTDDDTIASVPPPTGRRARSPAGSPRRTTSTTSPSTTAAAR